MSDNPYAAFATPVDAPAPEASSSPYAAFATPVDAPVAAPQSSPYEAFATRVNPPQVQAQPPQQAQNHANDFTPLAQGTEGSVPLDQAIATAHMRAAAHIQDLEQGRTFQKISDNPDGSSEYGYVNNPAGGRTVSPEEKQAILRAAIADAAGVGAGPQDTTDANGMKAAAARLQLQQAKSQNPVQNFAAAADNALASAGLGIAGQFAPQTANNLQDNLNYVSDPDAKASLAGSVAGGSGTFAAAQLADPSGNLAAAVMAAQAAGEARMEVARLRANGLNITPAQESMYVTDKALLAGATGKISAGAMVGKPLAGGVNEFANNGLINAGLGAGKAFATGAADMGANQSLGNMAAIGTGVDKNRDVSAGEGEAMLSGGLGAAAGHAVHAAAHPGVALPEPQTETKAPPAPEVKAPEAPPVPTEQQAKEAELQAEQQKAADTTAKPSEAPATASEHPPELADAKQVGDWYGKTFNDPANAQTIEALTSMHPGKYKLVDVPVDQIDPNAMMAGDTNRAKVDAIKNMTPEERAKMPPVIAVGEGDKLSIADGTHRLTAAQESGDKTIKAYVPEEFANDPSQLKRFISGDTAEAAAPEVKKALTDSGASIEYTDAAGKEQKGTYVSVSDNGEHWVRDENGKLDRVPASDITTQLPKIPAEARSESWSWTKLKEWAKENGYRSAERAPNLVAARKAIDRERNDSLVDLPRPPKDWKSPTMTHKKLGFWAEKNGYDLTGVEGKRGVIEAIKFQRKAALAEAKGKPLSDRAVEGHAQDVDAAKNAPKTVESGPKMPSTERLPHGGDKYFRSILENMKQISPAYAGQVHEAEYEGRRKGAEAQIAIAPARKALGDFFKGKDTFPIQEAIRKGDVEGAKALVPEKLRPAIDTLFQSSRDMESYQQQNGVEVGHIENHVHQSVKDYPALEKLLGKEPTGPIRDAWNAEMARTGKPLTEDRKVELANAVLNGNGPRTTSGKAGFKKERSDLPFTRETAKLYELPWESQHQYLMRAAEDTQRQKLLGRDSTEFASGPSVKNGQSAKNTSLGRVLTQELDSGRITEEGAARLKKLTTTYATYEPNTPALKAIRDTINIVTLGHITAPIKQLTDTGLTAALTGGKNAIKATKMVLGKNDQAIVAKTLGLDALTHESRDPSKLGQAVSTVLKLNGLAKIEMLQKEVRMTAYTLKNQEAVSTPAGLKEFAAEHKAFLRDHYDQTVTDLQAGRRTWQTDMLATYQLSKTRPLYRSGITPGEAESNTIGRLPYTLKKFGLHLVDTVRQEVLQNLSKPLTRAKGLKTLAGLIGWMGAAGFGSNAIINLMNGNKHEDMTEEGTNALLGIMNLDLHTVKGTITDPAKTITSMMGMPTPLLNDIAHDLNGEMLGGKTQHVYKDGKWQDVTTHKFQGSAVVRALPSFLGNIAYYWTPLGEGYYKNADAAKTEYRQELNKLKVAAEDADSAGDGPTAEMLIAHYNDAAARDPDRKLKPVKLATLNGLKQASITSQKRKANAAQP